MNATIPGCAASSLTIVKVAVLGLPIVAPPVGLERAKFTVSLDSKIASSTMGTVITLLVSPLLKVTTIGVLSKSPGAVAVPLVGVKVTVTVPSLPFVLIKVTGLIEVLSSLIE